LPSPWTADAGDDRIADGKGIEVLAATETTGATGTQAATWRSSAPANDTFVWDPGDGSDAVEGQARTDPRALRSNPEPANDTLAINAFAGDDVPDGGPGNNVLIHD
jgi:hypothetical protein